MTCVFESHTVAAQGCRPAVSSATGCAPAAQPLQPLVVDWASYFTVDWQATPQDGRALVHGTVWNPTGWRAKRIQFIEGLDATGQVASQRVVWLGLCEVGL